MLIQQDLSHFEFLKAAVQTPTHLKTEMRCTKILSNHVQLTNEPGIHSNFADEHIFPSTTSISTWEKEKNYIKSKRVGPTFRRTRYNKAWTAKIPHI